MHQIRFLVSVRLSVCVLGGVWHYASAASAPVIFPVRPPLIYLRAYSAKTTIHSVALTLLTRPLSRVSRHVHWTAHTPLCICIHAVHGRQRTKHRTTPPCWTDYSIQTKRWVKIRKFENNPIRRLFADCILRLGQCDDGVAKFTTLRTATT